jgi:CrcB protein
MLWIAIGGGAGAICRFLVVDWVAEIWPTSFPLGTFLVNLSGCFLIGVVMSYFYDISPMITTGFLGGYTTFSTYIFEAVSLFRQGKVYVAIIYLIVSLLGSVLFTITGFAIGNQL